MALKSYAEAPAAPTQDDGSPPQRSHLAVRIWAVVTARYPALASPLYSRYWRASAASIGATQLTVLAQGWLVFDLTGSPLYLGLLGAFASIPYLLVSLFGGVFADRFDKRSIILITTSVNALLLLTLATLTFSGHISVWQIWAAAGLGSFVNGIEWPTRQSIFVHLIPRDALPSAVALNSFLWQSGRMVAPAVGGLLLASLDTSAVFLAAAAGFTWMAVSLYRIPISLPGNSSEPAFAQISAGLRYVAGTPLFLGLITLTFSCMFFALSFMQLMPAFAALLDIGETGFGFLLSATGLGSVIGTLVTGAIRPRKSLGLLILSAALCTALSLLAFTLTLRIGSQTGAFLAVFAAAAFNSLFMINVMTVLQQKVPDSLRGRVMGIHSMSYSFLTLGGLFLGWLATLVGADLAVGIGASIFACLVVAIGFTSSSIRAVGIES